MKIKVDIPFHRSIKRRLVAYKGIDNIFGNILMRLFDGDYNQMFDHVKQIKI